MTSIGTINLAGLFKNINQQFSFIESFKELIDNSLDANAKNVSIRLGPTEFVFCDNGDGLSEANIVNKMMQLFLETQNNEGKRGNKGIGLKAALIKLTNYKNIDILTKTPDGDLFRVCFPIQTVIEKNDISLIKYNKASRDDEKIWEQFGDDALVCSSGTMIYSFQRDICQAIFDQVHLEELSKELEMVYSNFLHKTEIKLKYYQLPDLICKPHPLFNLVNTDNGWKPYRIRISSLRKEFLFYYGNRWFQVFPSSKKEKIKEFVGDFSFFNLKLNLYWWYTRDVATWLNCVGDTELCGFYSCREQKFSELGFKLPEKAQGDFSLQREITSKSLWILEFGAKLDELMGTIANKSKLSKAHMDPYIYNCIIEFARFILVKAIEELTSSKSQDPLPIFQSPQPQTEEVPTQPEIVPGPQIEPQTQPQIEPQTQPQIEPQTQSQIETHLSDLSEESQSESEGQDENEDQDISESYGESQSEKDNESESESESESETTDPEIEEAPQLIKPTTSTSATAEMDDVLHFIKERVNKVTKGALTAAQKQVCKELANKLLLASQ